MRQDIEVVPVEVRRDLPEPAPAPAALEPAPPEHGQNPLLVVHSLLRGRYPWAIALGLILAVAGALAGYRLAPLNYKSTAAIRIRPYIPRLLYSGTGETEGMPAFYGFLQSQISIIKNQRIIDMAMQDPEWRALGRGLDPTDVAQFISSLEATNPKGSDVIFVSFTDANQNAAMVATRAVVTAYETIYNASDEEGGAKRLRMLEDRREALTREHESLVKSIRAIAEEFGSSSLAPMYDFKLSEVNKLEAELKQAQLTRTLAESAQGIAAGTTRPANAAVAAIAPATLPAPMERSPELVALIDPVMRSYVERWKSQQTEVERLERTLGAKHTAVAEARWSIQTTEKLIADRLEFVKKAEEAGVLSMPGPKDEVLATPENLDRLRLREQRIEALYNSAKAELIDLGKKNLLIEQKRDEAAVVRQRLDDTRKRIEELNVEGSVGGRLDIISRGDKPLGPFNDKRKAVAAAGGLGGLGLGVGVFLLLGLADRRLRYIDDANASLRQSMPILGILPELPSGLDDPEQARLAGQCVHHIRAMLQIQQPSAGGGKVFLVTSPSPGSGKTSLTAALGLSFAACGTRTLLIDADIVGGGLTSKMDTIIRRKLGQILRREGLVTDQQIGEALVEAQASGQRLGEALVKLGHVTDADVAQALSVQQQSVVGLLDALSGEPVAECVTGTGIPGLFILPLGGAAAHHAPQLSPAAVARILDEARAEYDTVVVDTGPILGSLEAAILAPQADQVILVLARGEPRPMARRAMEFLFAAGASVAGAVFNRADGQDVLASSYSSGVSLRSVSRGRRPPAGEDGAAPQLMLGPIASAAEHVTQARKPPHS